MIAMDGAGWKRCMHAHFYLSIQHGGGGAGIGAVAEGGGAGMGIGGTGPPPEVQPGIGIESGGISPAQERARGRTGVACRMEHKTGQR